MILKKCKSFIAVTTSPRRIHLLQKVFPSVVFKAPIYKEKKWKWFLSPILLCFYYAFKKVQSIPCEEGKLYISFDTIVFKYFKIFKKPETRKNAFTCIKKLSNKQHKVITAICIKQKQKYKIYYEISTVKFKKLSNEKINEYIKTGEWKDKAGGYGIQGYGRYLIKWYKGNYYNIVGVPLNTIMALLHFS